MVLSSIEHENIITFIGYSLEPTLLIVMEFVAGGTLKDYLATHDSLNPVSFASGAQILMGAALGFRQLHQREPLPILHRDIKSENILLTKKLSARVADLGEARVMAENRTMTTGELILMVGFFLRVLCRHLLDPDSCAYGHSFYISVGTQGYTAPEVLRGEHYGTPADVYSFAIVMSEVVTMQPPYADLRTGESPVSLPQIVEMTKEPTSIRPTVRGAEVCSVAVKDAKLM